MSEFEAQLSPQGHRRREQILGSAIREAKLRRQQCRRRHRRGFAALASGTLGVVVATAVLNRAFFTHDRISPRPLPTSPIVAVATPSQIVVERIQTDPTICERMALVPKRQRWKPLGDQELLQVLADAGKPSGLIEVDGRALLVPRRSAQR